MDLRKEKLKRRLLLVGKRNELSCNRRVVQKSKLIGIPAGIDLYACHFIKTIIITKFTLIEYLVYGFATCTAETFVIKRNDGITAAGIPAMKARLFIYHCFIHTELR